MPPRGPVAPRALLERVRANDVGEGEPAARPQHSGSLLKDGVLDHGQVDYPVRDRRVEALVLEGQPLDPALRERDLGEAMLLLQAPGLGDLLVGEVDADERPDSPTRTAAQKTSVPEPEPRSRTSSPGFRPARPK